MDHLSVIEKRKDMDQKHYMIRHEEEKQYDE